MKLISYKMEEYYIIKVVDGKVAKVLCVNELPEELKDDDQLNHKDAKEHEYLDLKIALVKKLIEQAEKKNG